MGNRQWAMGGTAGNGTWHWALGNGNGGIRDKAHAILAWVMKAAGAEGAVLLFKTCNCGLPTVFRSPSRGRWTFWCVHRPGRSELPIIADG